METTLKKYFFIKELVVPLYDATVVIILSNDNEQIKPHFPEFNDKELYAITWVNEDRDDDKFYIGLNFDYSKKTIGHNTISHECHHCVNFILNSRGVLPEFVNDEPQAYLLDWCVKEVYKFIRDSNMKIEYHD